MDKFKLEIMASDHLVYDGEAESIVLPTADGSIGILAHHANLITAVVPGLIEYSGSEGRREIIVSDGFLKVEGGEVLILVDTAEKPDEIDAARAERAAQKAREELKRANSNRDQALVEAELSRALSRIKGSRKKHSL